jgi:hypothetical protein
MATKPLQTVLYRELSRVEAKELIDSAASLLEELVNWGTNALVRCAASAFQGVDEDLAILALYRHIIEMTDGIEVLISQACPIPAIPPLRSSFEALLSLEYILETEQHYVRRSLSWLVGYIHQRLDSYERLDPSTAKGAQFARSFEKDQFAFDISWLPPAEVQAAQANLRSLLEKPHLRPVEAEFNKHRKPNWYQLFGGPKHLYALAEHLNKGAQYEFLYRPWSRTAHAQDLLPFLDRTANGKQTIGKLRDPGKIREVSSFASSFMLYATRLVLVKLRPGEDWSRWYMREVQARYSSIAR